MSNAKLKVILTAILLVFAIVPALIIGAVGTFSIVGYESNTKTDTLKTVSRSKSIALDQAFTHYVSNVNMLATSDLLIDAVDSTDEAHANSILAAVADANPDILDIIVINANGNVIASAKQVNIGGTFEHFDETLSPVSGIRSWSSYNNAQAFYVSKEIFENPTGLTGSLGHVCAIVSVGADSRIAKALNGTFLDSGRMIAFDTSGNVINFGGDMAVTTADPDIAQDLQEIVASTSNVNITSLRQELSTGKFDKYTYCAGIIPQINTWRWAGIVESGSIGSFALKTNLICWGVVLVSCALAALVGWLIVNKFTGNMSEMLRTMDAIAEEENGYEIRFKIKNRKSELGRIKDAFNDMLDEVIMSEERHRTIAELSDNMLFEWDFHKESMYVSKNTLAKFEIDTANSTLSNGRFIDALMSTDDAEKYKRDISQLLRDKNGYSAEYQLKAKSGTVIWVSLRAVCITDRLGEPLRVIGVMTDIDNEKKMELQLSERASFDFLSQLYNRNTFTRTLTAELERRGANKIALLFIDVDDFKFINDRYGHTIGDEVIKYVADTIRVKVDDKGGFAGRFGGDEFVLCFTDQEDIENIENISMDIINELYVGYTTSDGSMTINVKASIGIALCPEHSEDVNELLMFSDTAMYFVKKNGKTNYHMYCPEDTESGEYIDPEF
ncbi:MAG: diguanylate cyclase [Ruminococcaceae bacterium]|nr:diguanylate cyclase [Oscillospiraceae bacterium]